MTVMFGLVAGPVGGTAQTPPDSTRSDSSAVRLAPIRVTVTRDVRALRTVPFAVGVADGDDIRAGRPGRGLDEALLAIPGVLVSNRYNPSLDQRIAIRGFGARSAFGVRGVRVLIDDIPQTLPDGQGQLTNLDLSEIAAVEVLRGSASSLYGNATGGVILVRTRDPAAQRLAPGAAVSVGAFGTVRLSSRVSAPLSGGGLGVTITRTTSDGFRRHARADLRQVALRYTPTRPAARTRVRVSLRVADAPTLDNPGSLTRAELSADPTSAAPRNVAANAGKDVTQAQAGVTIERDVAGGTMRVTGYGLTRRLDNPLSFAFIDLDRRVAGLRAGANLPIGSAGARLTLGVDLQHQRDDRRNETPDRTALTRDQRETVTELGPFVRASVPIPGGVTLSGGVRFDRLAFRVRDHLLADGDDSGRRTLSDVSWSLGAVATRIGPVVPWVSVGTSFEGPTTTELANRPTGPGGFNPALDPQHATTVEAGVRGNVGEVLSYSAAAYRTAVTDALVPFEVPTDPGRRFFRNAGSATYRGIEVAIDWHPGPAWRTRVALTTSDFRFDRFRAGASTFDGNRIPGVPARRLYASARYAAGPWWVAWDQTLQSSMPVNDANTDRTSPFATTGLRAGFDGRLGAWAVHPYLGVLNAFDDAHVASVVVNASFGRYFEPAPRRNVYVGVRVDRR